MVDAGLAFAVPKSKTGYIGEAAVAERRASGPQNRLIQLLATDPQIMFYHNEPIYRDGKQVGYLTSGNYGHHLGGSVGMGYIPCAGEAPADILASKFEVLVNGKMAEVTASIKPLYDPAHEAMKA